jgi:CRISPR-associated protein (TIGR02584 family)
MRKTGYKETFIFISGSTPQVITETIYGLATKNPPIYPEEVFIITTAKGREIAREALVEKGILKSLQSDYGIPPIVLTDESFVIPKDPSGSLLDDIRDYRENEIMGDLITSFIRGKTVDLSIRLHCSLAGGRKTMSFYLGAALQLFGRPWDRLYHVLVSSEFESNPDFFYKPKKDRILTPLNLFLNKGGHGGLKRLNTRNAEVTLAELPFIRLRNKLSLYDSGFRTLVEEGQREIDTAVVLPELVVSLAERTISIGQKTVKLPPMHLMIYTAYLKQKVNRCKFPERPYCLDCTECFPSLLELTMKPALEEMAKDYMIMCRSRVGDLLNRYREGFPTEVLRQAISKIRKALSEQLKDETLASHYAITTSLRGYGDTRHGVRVEKRKIQIID